MFINPKVITDLPLFDSEEAIYMALDIQRVFYPFIFVVQKSVNFPLSYMMKIMDRID